MTDDRRKLIGELADAAPVVRRRAMSSLGIGDESGVPAFLADCLSDDEVGDSDAVTLLAGTMRTGSEMAKIHAAAVLGELRGDEARELLIAALDDMSLNVNAAAVGSLGKFDDPDLMPHFITALQQKDDNVCRAAIGVVEKLKDERAAPALLDILDIGHRKLRLESTWALQAIGGPQVLRAAIPLLKHRSRPVRESASDIVGYIGGDEALDALIEALPHLGRPYLQLLFMPEDGYWSLARRLVNMGGTRGLSRLAHMLTDWPEIDISSAEWALDRLRKPEMVDQFLEELGSGHSHDRMYAAYGLGVLGDIRAYEPLVHSLQDFRECVVAAAAEALGRLDDDRAIEHLAALIPNEDLGVRAATAASLGRLGSARGIEPLTRLMYEEDDIEVSGMARKALVRLQEVTEREDEL